MGVDHGGREIPIPSSGGTLLFVNFNHAQVAVVIDDTEIKNELGQPASASVGRGPILTSVLKVEVSNLVQYGDSPGHDRAISNSKFPPYFTVIDRSIFEPPD